MKVNDPTEPKFPHIVNNSKELISFKNHLEKIGYIWEDFYGNKPWRTDYDKALYPLCFVKMSNKKFHIIREY